MVILLLNLLFGIHAVNKSVLARVIKDYVYTEPGGNVTLNCSNSGGINQWTFKPRHEDTLLTISENEKISLYPPEFHYHYEVTDAETYNLQIVNATSFTEGRYGCLANITTDSIHWVFLLLKAPPSELRVINMTERNTIIGNENENLTLACYTIGGIPRGKTIWYHGKKKLTTNEDDNETAYYSLILNRNHNGQIYTCIAIHDMLSSPLNQTITLDILYQPRVQFMRPNGPVSIGQNVNLSCSYYSNPLDAKISWTKNTQTVDYSHSIVTNIVVKSERKLTEIDIIIEDTQRVTSIMFENVTKTDEGEYTCNVTNTEGSASETVYLVVQDNDSETVPYSSPPYSGTYVKGFSMKEQMLYGVIVVLVVLVLIIMSLVGHAYIRIRCKQTNYTVPNTDVVRQTSFEIEMRDITSTDHDENDTLRNQPSLTNREVTLDDDRHSDLSTTHSRSSSLHSNRAQNMNEDDYLHPYHSLVHNSMDVHAYAIVDRYENVEYEEIADVFKN